MDDKAAEQDLRARWNASLHFVSYLGIEHGFMKDGRAEMYLELGPEHLNSGGIAHGGVLASLADCVGGAAAYSVIPADRMAVTTDLHLTCLSNVGRGRITARGELAHRGRRFLNAGVELWAADKLLARGSISFMVVERAAPA